jgi:PLP dependent protein
MVSDSIAHLQNQLSAAAHAAGRGVGDVQLLAASKMQDVETIRQALDAGHRLFGENRVQEAKSKWPALRHAYPDVRLHLIGPLQTNKVKEAVPLFDVIETLDRDALATEIAKAGAKYGKTPRCLIEVNIGAEPQKAGILPSDLERFYRFAHESCGLSVDGLMCIPPHGQPPLPFFQDLAKWGQRLGLQTLSMGMSGDFEAAIAAGSTQIRVGTALFGSRPSPL